MKSIIKNTIAVLTVIGLVLFCVGCVALGLSTMGFVGWIPASVWAVCAHLVVIGFAGVVLCVTIGFALED